MWIMDGKSTLVFEWCLSGGLSPECGLNCLLSCRACVSYKGKLC